MQHGRLVIEPADDGAALRIRADHQADGAVAVHVVEPVLRIVFDDEDAGLRPEAAAGDPFHHSSQGQVIVRHLRARGRRPRGSPGGVVVRQENDHQVGQLSLLLVLPELLQEHVRAQDIGNPHVPSRILGAAVPAQRLDANVL